MKFFIYPHIYRFTSGNKQVLYNTKTGTRIESDSADCKELIDEIYKPANLGVIDLIESRLNSQAVQPFIDRIIRLDFGRAIEAKPGSPRIINLLPILNLQDDVERLKNDDESDVGEKSLRYLNELNIYLNNRCDLNCPHCNLYYKQTKSCCKSPTNTFIQPDTIKGILDSLAYSSLKKINFSGGNILLYPHLDKLITLLKSYDFDFHFWIHIRNLINANRDWDFAKEIIISFPIDSERIEKYINTSKNNKKQTCHFFIGDESQYNTAISIIESTGISNYQIIPVYTGKNRTFFEENIYLFKEDIFASPIPHRIIFCNQKLNSNNFGKLYILSDGEIKANINTSTLGNIYKNNLLEIIREELITNTAWRVIRKESPCNDCLYQYLCPSPSNYETIIGKPNLCHVKP
jgi:pseudo-rSAM protein